MARQFCGKCKASIHPIVWRTLTSSRLAACILQLARAETFSTLALANAAGLHKLIIQLEAYNWCFFGMQFKRIPVVDSSSVMLEYTKQLFCWWLHLATAVQLSVCIWNLLASSSRCWRFVGISTISCLFNDSMSYTQIVWMFEVVQFSITNALLWNRHMQPSITLEQWLHLSPSPSVVTWVRKMKQNCGSLKFFLKIVIHRYYSVFLVGEWMWHTYCDSLLHVQVLCQDAICCLFEDSSMLGCDAV